MRRAFKPFDLTEERHQLCLVKLVIGFDACAHIECKRADLADGLRHVGPIEDPT